MKEKAYKKEIIVTIVFIILYLLMGHTASLFVLFPGLQGGVHVGISHPLHYPGVDRLVRHDHCGHYCGFGLQQAGR